MRIRAAVGMRTMIAMKNLLALLVLLFAVVLPPAVVSRLPCLVAAFTAVPTKVVSSSLWKNTNERTSTSRSSSCHPFTVLLASKNKNSLQPVFRNEFSRTIPPDRIKTTRGSGFRMPLLQANETECQALAMRFGGFIKVLKLEASVTLRPESLGGSSSTTTTTTDFGIEAQGTVLATITQTCVRTNEQFDVDLEFPIYAIVRPAVVAATRQQYYNSDNDEEYDEYVVDDAAAAMIDNSKKKSDNNNQRRKKSIRGGSGKSLQNFNEMDLLQLQRMMQQDISVENDALMQDESIYTTAAGGLLDVGELVTQLFFLQIDPYPKKPGTSPVQRSISTTTTTRTSSTRTSSSSNA